jgi:hypothetical protein
MKDAAVHTQGKGWTGNVNPFTGTQESGQNQNKKKTWLLKSIHVAWT